MTSAGPRDDLLRALEAGASSVELLVLVEALQVAGQTFAEIEAWLYGLDLAALAPAARARLEAFLAEDLDAATELTADGIRFWDFLHHGHGEELGFGECVTLKAIGRPGHGLFLYCQPGDFPSLEPYRVDSHHVFLGAPGRLKVGEAALSALRRWHQQLPLFEESGGRRLIDRLTSALREAPVSGWSVVKTGEAPETWQLCVGGRWRELAIRAAEALAQGPGGGALRRL